MTQRRIYQCAFPYHITFNVLDREWFFDDEAKTEILYEIILNAGDMKNHAIYQFCIMPDHVHLLYKTDDHTDIWPPHRTLEKVRCGDGDIFFRNEPFPGCGAALSNFVQSIKGTFSRKMHMGHIWQRRFHDEIIQTEEQLESVINYIYFNPIKAELPEKWSKHPYQYKNNELTEQLFR
jgi:putative transposase